MRESGAMRREMCKPRFSQVIVGNAVSVTNEEGIALGAKSEVFGRILPRESKRLVKRHDNSLWERKRQ